MIIEPPHDLEDRAKKELAAFEATLAEADYEADRDGWMSLEDLDRKLAARRAI